MAAADTHAIRGWLRLLATGIPHRHLTDFCRVILDPAELFDASEESLRGRFGLTPEGISRLHKPISERLLDKQLSLMEQHGIRLVPLADAEYPRNLFHMRVPPPVIFVKGTLEDFDALSVGIVGPRYPTGYGLEVTTALARDLAPAFTIVSGAALGIDSRAHETTLRQGGRTFAVLGCGIDVDYPAQNRRLRERIPRDGGALISIFPPATQPMRGNFPARNFILAGLSLAVIVTEASAKSGALVTARAAGEEGRPVYAVPGDINRLNSAGSNGLLRDGAIALTSAADLIGDLENLLTGELEALCDRRRAGVGADHHDTTPPNPDEPPSTSHEAALLETIRHAPVSHDDLMERFVPARMTVGDLSTALLMLEMDGRIVQRPGRVYAAAV